MKRLLGICATMALLFSCAESPEIADDVTTTTPGGGDLGGIPITATISMPQSEDTRISCDNSDLSESAVWDFTWERKDKEDHVYAYYKTSDGTYGFAALTGGDDLNDGDESATFSGTIPVEESIGIESYRIIYKSPDVLIGGEKDPIGVTDGSASIDLNMSADTYNFGDSSLGNLVMISDLYDGNELDIAPTMKHVGSFMVLDVSFAEVQDHWVGVEIEDITYEGDICVSTGEDSSIPYWSASSEELFKDKTFEKKATTIKYTTTYEDCSVVKGHSILLYFNILPMEFGADDKATITISFSNGTKLVVTKTGLDGITFDRATFNTFEVTYASSDYVSAGAVNTPDYNTYSNTDANSLKYIFGSESSADTDVLFDEENLTSGTYYIWTEDHLAALAALANDGKIQDGGCTFMLKDDITITRSWWTPIGYKGVSYSGRNEHYNQHFAGTFDGDGKSIINHKITIPGDGDIYAAYSEVFVSLGVFGYITTKDNDNNDSTSTTYPITVVKNLIIKNGTSSLGNLSGRHVAILTGTLENAIMINCGCDSDCSATVENRGAIGGLVGYASASHIYNSYNQGSVSGATIQSITEDETGKDITSYVNIGGICGATFSGGTDVYNCYNIGKLSVDDTNGNGYYMGAIIGHENVGNTCENVFYCEGVAPLGAVIKTQEDIECGGTIDSDGTVTLLEGGNYHYDYTPADNSLKAALHAYIVCRGGSHSSDDSGNTVLVSDWTNDTYPTLTFEYDVESNNE